MKKIKALIALFILFLFVLNTHLYSQTTPIWSSDWANYGDNTIGGWNINTEDNYTSGNFLGINYGLTNRNYNLASFSHQSGWCFLMHYDDTFGWQTDWTNNGSGNITGWNIDVTDKVMGLYGGENLQEDLLVLANSVSGWLSIKGFTNTDGGHGYWTNYYSNQGSGNFNGWNMSLSDRYLTGQFDPDYTPDDILVINPADGWASLHLLIPNKYFSSIWGNGGSGDINGWVLRTSDIYLRLGSNLMAVNPRNGWAAIFAFNGSGWSTIWSNGGNGWINAWHIDQSTSYSEFEFNPGQPSLMSTSYNTGYTDIQYYNSAQNTWSLLYSNGGSGNINGWGNRADDKYNFGYFSYNNSESYYMPINPNTHWASLMRHPGLYIQDNKGTEPPKDYALKQNYPNPFNPTTNIEFALPKAANVSIKVYDQLGKEVQTLVNEFKDIGRYNISFDASNLASGIYYYKIVTSEFNDIKKLVVIK